MNLAASDNPQSAFARETERVRLAVAKGREKKKSEVTVTSGPDPSLRHQDERHEDGREDFLAKAEMAANYANWSRVEIVDSEVMLAAMNAGRAWSEAVEHLGRLREFQEQSRRADYERIEHKLD